MQGFAATVVVRVRVPFAAPNEGPHRAEDLPERVTPGEDATPEQIEEAEAAHQDALREFADTVEENRIAAARHAETEVCDQVGKALAGLGEVVDVMVEKVEEDE